MLTLIFIVAAVRYRFRSCSDAEIEVLIKRHLSNARDREGGRLKRAHHSGRPITMFCMVSIMYTYIFMEFVS